MLKVTNTQPGPRGLNAVGGPVLVEPGATFEGKVYAREKEHLEACGWFEIKGQYEADPKGLGIMTVGVVGADKLKEAQDGLASVQDELARVQGELTAAKADKEAAERLTAEREAEIADLRRQLDSRPAPVATQGKKS